MSAPAPDASITRLDFDLTCRVVPLGEHFICGLKADWLLICHHCDKQWPACDHCWAHIRSLAPAPEAWQAIAL